MPAEEVGAAELLCLFLKGLDEQPADDLALGFRVADAFELTDETIGGIDVQQVQIVVLAEHGDDAGRLVLAHQAVVDEDAGQLVADGLVDQQGCDGAVDAARKRADDTLVAHLRADLLDRLLPVGRHRPVALDAGNVVNEITDQLGAIRRMHDLGMELHAVIFPLLVGDEGVGRVGGGGDHLETIRQRGDAVAMAHPDLMARAGGPEALEQLAVPVDLEEGAAEFAVMTAFDLAAELHAHRLLAVADAEDRQAAVEDDLGRSRRPLVHRGSRAAGQDHGLRLQAFESLFGRLEGNDLAIDAGLAHAPCDELGHPLPKSTMRTESGCAVWVMARL